MTIAPYGRTARALADTMAVSPPSRPEVAGLAGSYTRYAAQPAATASSPRRTTSTPRRGLTLEPECVEPSPLGGRAHLGKSVALPLSSFVGPLAGRRGPRNHTGT